MTNAEAIAVNQNYAGHPGRLVKSPAPVQVWVKPQPKGALAVYVVNPTSNTGAAASVSVDFATLGLGGTTATVRDIWRRQDAADATGSELKVTVPEMDSVFLLLTPK